MATIRTANLPDDFRVKPQVQALADAVQAEFGITSFGTYEGHEPTASRAVDIFANKAQGDRVAPWVVAHIDRYSIDYVIWWQRIYNPEISPKWRDMPDRGGTTQNHKDHVHVSFNPTAAGTPETQGDLSMADVQHILDVLEADKQFWITRNAEQYNKILGTLEALGIAVHEDDGVVDVDKLAASLSKTLGVDVAKALGERLANG